MRIRKLSSSLAAFLLAAAAAGAHHSLADYDDSKIVEIAGTVEQFQWTNPHTLLVIGVADAAGVTHDWNIQGQAPKFLAWRGWSKDTLKAGDRVSLKIYPLKNGARGGTCLRVTLPDGRVMFMLENPPQAR